MAKNVDIRGEMKQYQDSDVIIYCVQLKYVIEKVGKRTKKLIAGEQLLISIDRDPKFRHWKAGFFLYAILKTISNYAARP